MTCPAAPERTRPADGAASHKAAAEAASRRSERPLHLRPPRRWQDDRRGALLILTGVLLVLGFVILGTTLVQLNASEDKSNRSQRDPLMESVDSLVRSFSTGLQNGVALGDTDIDAYLDYTLEQEALLRDTATRTGLYADAHLNPNPALVTYTGANGCGSPHQASSRDGVIIGYEKHTLTETIVGAVYTLEFTDGRQKVSMDHYVKIHECTPGDLLSFPRGLSQHMGGATPLLGLTSADDERLGVTVVEELTGITSYTNWAHWNGTTGLTLGWNSEQEIALNDNKFANRPSPPIVDSLKFRFNATEHMNETKRAAGGALVFNDFTLVVDAKENINQPLLGANDFLQIKAYRPHQLLFPYWTHNFTLTADEVRYELDPPAPSGNPEWTYDELLNTTWELTTHAVLTRDGDHSYHVDFVRPNVTYSGPIGHQMNLEFDWPLIPDLYGEHALSGVYQIPGTTGEQFQIQVFNNTTQQWDDIGAPWVASGTSWIDWHINLPTPLDEGHHYYYDDEDDLLLIRLVDTTDTDLDPTDRDTVHIDFFAVTSRFLGVA